MLRRCALALAVCSSLASPAMARGAGLSVATVAIPADGQSAAVAVNVARIADETFARDPDAELLDLERVLEGGDPIWVEKLAAAERAAQKGRQALDAVELPVAADAFAESIVAYEQAVPGLRDVTALVEVLALQGQVFVLQGDTRSARSVFARVLVLDPAYRFPKETPARVLSAFDAVVKERRSAGSGTLTVYATTGAAEVWVDGVFRGIAPFTVDVGAGRHYVRVVRDGYLAWGTGAEVKRGSETSVQASLRPASQLARYEELAARVPRNKESVRPVAELAAALQVDRLLAIVVEDSNGSAFLTATLVDGVSGQQLARATRAFAPGDSFFERDVRGFLKERIGNIGAEARPAALPDEEQRPLDKASLLPGAAAPVETPGAVIGGWVLVGTGSALAINTVICGILSFHLFDSYRNKLPSQLDPNLEGIRTTWLTMSLVTDASWILGAAALGGGTALLISGYAEQKAQEEIVNP
jgi:hypothetical protein